MNHYSARLCVGILLLPPQILAATSDPRAEARVRANNIILLEDDLLGDVQQEAIQSEGALKRDAVDGRDLGGMTHGRRC